MGCVLADIIGETPRFFLEVDRPEPGRGVHAGRRRSLQAANRVEALSRANVLRRLFLSFEGQGEPGEGDVGNKAKPQKIALLLRDRRQRNSVGRGKEELLIHRNLDLTLGFASQAQVIDSLSPIGTVGTEEVFDFAPLKSERRTLGENRRGKGTRTGGPVRLERVERKVRDLGDLVGEITIRGKGKNAASRLERLSKRLGRADLQVFGLPDNRGLSLARRQPDLFLLFGGRDVVEFRQANGSPLDRSANDKARIAAERFGGGQDQAAISLGCSFDSDFNVAGST